MHSFIKLHVLKSTNLVNVAFSLILLRYQIHSLSSHSPISFPSPPFYITCSFSLQYSHLFSKTSSCFFTLLFSYNSPKHLTRSFLRVCGVYRLHSLVCVRKNLLARWIVCDSILIYHYFSHPLWKTRYVLLLCFSEV